MGTPVEITAGRLHLRPWLPYDAGAVFEACQDAQVQRWTTVPSPYARQDARSFVEEVSPKGWEAGTDALFAVLDATTGDLLASVGLMGIADGRAEVGYWAVAQARGRGVVPDAVGALCRWGFADRGLQRITWLAEVGNHPSRRVAEKAGFSIEGTLRAYLAHRGTRVDAWIGSRLATDPPV